jgi:hypothetical protein
MAIKVSVSLPKIYTSTVKKQKKINVSARSGIIMARKLADLLDVDVSNVQDKFVLMYDATEKKYKAYDPDEILTASLNNGLPQDFINYLNDTLNPESLITAINQILEYIDTLTLGRLANVKSSVDTASDTFIIRYDEVSGQYEAVDPDEILSSAIDETGLPVNFIQYLNEVLVPQSLAEALNNLLDQIQNLTLGDLANVNDLGVLNKYVIMYDDTVGLYKTVNPDEVLKAAVEETTEPGLPEEFLQQLDDDLDNRIDTDAGFF